MYIKRTIEDKLIRLLENFPSVAILAQDRLAKLPWPRKSELASRKKAYI